MKREFAGQRTKDCMHRRWNSRPAPMRSSTEGLISLKRHITRNTNSGVRSRSLHVGCDILLPWIGKRKLTGIESARISRRAYAISRISRYVSPMPIMTPLHMLRSLTRAARSVSIRCW